MNSSFISELILSNMDVSPELYATIIRVEAGVYGEYVAAKSELALYKLNADKSVPQSEYDALNALYGELREVYGESLKELSLRNKDVEDLLTDKIALISTLAKSEEHAEHPNAENLRQQAVGMLKTNEQLRTEIETLKHEKEALIGEIADARKWATAMTAESDALRIEVARVSTLYDAMKSKIESIIIAPLYKD